MNYYNEIKNKLIDNEYIQKKKIIRKKHKVITYFENQKNSFMYKKYSPYKDYTYIGQTINIVKNFKINNVIFNKGEYNNLENELIHVLKSNEITYYKSKYIFKV